MEKEKAKWIVYYHFIYLSNECMHSLLIIYHLNQGDLYFLVTHEGENFISDERGVSYAKKRGTSMTEEEVLATGKEELTCRGGVGK